MYRRLRGDLIETYKLTHGLYKVDTSKYITLSNETRTRGHSYKLEKQIATKEVRTHFFKIFNVGQ